MSQRLSITATQTFLTAAEQDHLIAVVQGLTVELTAEEVALQSVILDTTDPQAALEKLMGSYIKLIEKLAGKANPKALSHEDAQSELVLAFIEAVHRHDLSKGIEFGKLVPSILKGALSVAQGTSDVIVIPETIALRYWRTMGDADMDLQVAYANCRKHDLAPQTFLAVHHSLSMASLDTAIGGENGDHDSSHDLSFVAASHEADIVTADLVRWLFSQVTERQETICRVRYGFRDIATETILVEHGIHLGEVLSDIQVAAVTGIGAKTVDRDRRKALADMKVAYLAALAEA